MNEKKSELSITFEKKFQEELDKLALLGRLVKEFMVSSYDSIRAREYPVDHKLGGSILGPLNQEVYKKTGIDMSGIKLDSSIEDYAFELGKKISDKKLLELTSEMDSLN